MIFASWQQQLANGFKDPHELLDYLNVSPEVAGLSAAAHHAFKIRVPKIFAQKMRSGDPRDPLLLQVLPHHHETDILAGYSADPLEETQANPIKGLLHKYSSRVLITLTAGCAVHCRYCFRRHFDYKSNAMDRDDVTRMLDYIQSRPDIKEVILSGGDPLLVPDERLGEIVEKIAAIPTIDILRFHTRMPIVLPDRITPEFIDILKKARLQMVCVVHCNHPNELDDAIQTKITALREAGVHVLNQAVLLRGINDNADVLCALSYQLFKTGILPYYLHVPDKVAGTAHFDVDEVTAKKIHQIMRENLPGYLLPRLVREVPGELSKRSV